MALRYFGKELAAIAVAVMATAAVAQTWNCGAGRNMAAVTATLHEGKLTISGSGAMANYDTFPDNITVPWFESKRSIVSLVIGDSVTSIGNSAFQGCTGLTSAKIPNSITFIGSKSFADCASLTSVTIPNSVTSIKTSTFYGCVNLTSVTIPNSLTSIESRAFYQCKSLTSIISLNPTPPVLERTAFDRTNKTNVCLYVASGSIDSYRSAANWNAFGCIKDAAPR